MHLGRIVVATACAVAASLAVLVSDHGAARASDPEVWRVTHPSPWNGGVLATAGNLVFTGHQTGELAAYDATTGELLWSFRTGSGIIGMPVTWEQDGKQYVAVASGIGGVLRKDRAGSGIYGRDPESEP